MENQITVDLSKSSIQNTNDIKNVETDPIEKSQFHEHQNQPLSQLQQQLKSLDKDLCIDINKNNTNMNSNATSSNYYLESITPSLQNIIKGNKSEFVIQKNIISNPNNNNNEINSIPIPSDLIQSEKPITTDICDLNNENKFIKEIRNYNEITPLPSSTLTTITTTTTSLVIKPLTVTNSNITPTTIEITQKESESLNENKCNDTNNSINDTTVRYENNKNNETQENNKKINNDDNIKYFENQQQKITLPPIIQTTSEAKILSAVCNNNNESKSDYLNSSNCSSSGDNKQVLNNDDDEKTIDVDVITISSTDENLIEIENNEKLEDEKEKEEKQKLTEKSLQNSMNLQRTQSKTESVLEYLNSVEPTVTKIEEKLIDYNNSNLPLCVDGSSSISSTNLLNESESEEDDQLKPLMQDNHTIIVNHEFYVYNNDNYHNQNYDDIINAKELDNVNYCSTDSDLSTQFDHRDLTNLSQNSSEDYNDSGLETLSNQLQQQPTQQHSSLKSYSTKHMQLKKVIQPVPPAPATTPVEGVTDTSQLNTIHQSSEQSDVREIDTLAPMEIPDDKLCEDIVEQVEYYFSNENILKDAFLLKHVRRNKEGFVSLKLVSSFKRVRQFTKDWRVVGNAVERKSKRIELNDLGSKIRRLEPLPNFDETMPSRTIVVCDLPYEKLSIEKITDIFTKCGEIALIRILKPGMQIPVDVRQFMNKYPEMQQKECALVEFIDSSSARFAKSMQGNYKIFDMVAPKKKTGKKSITTITKFIENYKYPDTNYERTRGGIENVHHYQNYNHGHNINYHNNNNSNINNQHGHHNHYNMNNTNNHVLQNNNNNNNNYDHEFRPKLRSNYDIRNSQQLQQQNQDTQLQNFVYQPPNMQQRRYSTSDQENNNREYIQNMNSLNNQVGNNYGSNTNNNTNNNNIHFTHYPPRRMSNCSMNDLQSRKYSSCSEGYSSCSEYSRRPSLTSSQDSSSRKTSTSCSEYCPCSRRTSQCSDVYRKMSQQSDIVNSSSPNRRFSNGSFHGFERQYSNPNDQIILNNHNNNNNNTIRRISFDSNYDRKLSSSSINSNNNNNNQQQNGQHICDNHFRKFSNGFDPNRKLSFTDQYFNGRRISTDSGYDRKLSFSSDISSTSTSPRSRANSFILPSQHKTAEILVRTPIGPDGSKGFASRARKLGQIAVESVN